MKKPLIISTLTAALLLSGAPVFAADKDQIYGSQLMTSLPVYSLIARPEDLAEAYAYDPDDQLPFDDDPPSQLRRMEVLRERLEAGELDLAAAAVELGGSVEDLGWRGFESLGEEIPGKARTSRGDRCARQK